jgi:hypothetical protein
LNSTELACPKLAFDIEVHVLCIDFEVLLSKYTDSERYKYNFVVYKILKQHLSFEIQVEE